MFDMIHNCKPYLWLFFLVYFKCSFGFPGDDITGNPEFGCQWTGGSIDSGVTCNCRLDSQEFFIQKGSIPSYDAQVFKINGCNSVRFGIGAISEMRNLRRLELANINSLQLEESSLSWNAYVHPNSDYHQSWDGVPTLRIKIERSVINKISSYTFQGQISTIIMRDLLVEEIAPFAFSSLVYTHTIEFSNVNFVHIHAQAFKKFPTDILTITDSSFTELPSRSFSDTTVLDSFQVRNCTFDTIQSGAFLIHNCKRFEVVDCEINLLEGEGFKVTTRGSVKIKNNNFNVTHDGAFMGISLNLEEVPTEEEIWFDSDTFNTLDKRSLQINTTSFSARYSNIVVNQQCNCDFMEGSDNNEQFQCILDQVKKITLKEFKENNCSILASYSTIFIILGVVVVLFIIIFSGLMYYFKRVYRKRTEYITDKNGKPVSLIMPDGRTYRETELHVVVERADLLTTDL